MLFVGECLNATRKAVRQAVLSRDEAFIAKLALTQVESGANLLDVNAGTGQGDEVEDLVWLTRTVQAHVDVSLCLDSSNPEALREALRVHRGIPMLNSISAEPHKLESLLPLIESNPCKVVALCLGSSGIPNTADERLEIARFLVGELTSRGVKYEDIYVDPVVLSAVTEQNAGRVTLDTISLVKSEMPEVKVIVAISNVGFGLPKRSLLNRTFAALAMARGADALLIDTMDRGISSEVIATQAIMGQDTFCCNYSNAYRKGALL